MRITFGTIIIRIKTAFIQYHFLLSNHSVFKCQHWAMCDYPCFPNIMVTMMVLRGLDNDDFSEDNDYFNKDNNDFNEYNDNLKE